MAQRTKNNKQKNLKKTKENEIGGRGKKIGVKEKGRKSENGKKRKKRKMEENKICAGQLETKKKKKTDQNKGQITVTDRHSVRADSHRRVIMERERERERERIEIKIRPFWHHWHDGSKQADKTLFEMF